MSIFRFWMRKANQPTRVSLFEEGHGMETGKLNLICLNSILYDGNWNEMEKDLRGRLDRKPRNYGLFEQIMEDLGNIESLRRDEEKSGKRYCVVDNSGTYRLKFESVVSR